MFEWQRGCLHAQDTDNLRELVEGGAGSKEFREHRSRGYASLECKDDRHTGRRQWSLPISLEKVVIFARSRNIAPQCHLAGGELEQIQFLLGHVSVQTTERYLGCKQRCVTP